MEYDWDVHSKSSRVVLPNISLQTYLSLLKDFDQEPAIRLTYDQGNLEIRMLLDPHESYKKTLGRLIEAATEELDIEIRSLGSRTCNDRRSVVDHREDLAKGLEPDQCYYFQNEAIVRGVEQIDVSIYPPPDLALEIDIMSSSVNRMEIYAALGIPEVWRFDGDALTMMELREGHYKAMAVACCPQDLGRSKTIANSSIFPMLKPEVLRSFLDQRTQLGENAIVKQFRQWIQENK